MWIIIAIVAAVTIMFIIGWAAWSMAERRKTERLRQTFGPEYDRTIEELGKSDGEDELEARRARAGGFRLRQLQFDEYRRFKDRWNDTQARFVDSPGATVNEADRLVSELMRARGYPVGDFEQRAADLSVDHPEVVANYRAAHRVAVANSHGEASTEDMRLALVHYRALFDDLLTPVPNMPPTAGQRSLPHASS